MQSIIDTLTSTVAATHAEDLRAAFAADPQRFSRFSASLDDLLMDYSKCAVNDEVLDQLEQLLVAAGVAHAAGADLGQVAKQSTNWTAIAMFGAFVIATLGIAGAGFELGEIEDFGILFGPEAAATEVVVPLVFEINQGVADGGAGGEGEAEGQVTPER